MRLYQLLKDLSDNAADQLALCSDCKSITYKQLFQIITINSKIIQKHLKKGNAIILRTEDKYKFVIAFLSYVMSGIWCVPLPSDIKEGQVHDLKKMYGLSEALCTDELCYDETKINNVSEEGFHYSESGIYHLTSGSTGFPKLCVRDIEALLAEGLNYKETLSIRKNEKILCLAPVNHSFALGAGLMASIVSKATIYLIDMFTPRNAINVIASFGVNIVIAVPAMIRTMNKVNILQDLEFGALRIVLVGAGPVSISEQSKFKKRFGVYIYGNYGSTETGGLFTRAENSYSESIGVPMKGISVKLLDSNNVEVEKGEVGELYVKCPYSMVKYYQDTESIITDDGFLPMGDLVQQNADGQYYIVGRLKKMIRIGGKQVNPYEVEQCILKYPQIEDAHVYEDRREDGEVIVAAVIVGKNVDDTSLRKFLSDYLEGYKIPTNIVRAASIKRNSLGKIIQQGGQLYD